MISVENLSKRYKLGKQKFAAASFAETLNNLATKGFWHEHLKNRRTEFYALRNINFEISAGEVVGLIGRNGSGKSTLLKIMAQIVFPTAGSVTLNGRVGALLEVGAGFNLELTGRENIFLSGAILGMSYRETRRKFNEIVAFAEVEKFIDNPVKHYSNGMYLRLAFAVAAHLEPEILFLDEVLSVGDFEFQKRCLAKIRELSRHEGRTVLLVSHNLTTIENLCPRAIWLDAGQIKMDGESEQVTRAFKQSGAETPAHYLWENAETAPGDDVVRLRGARLIDENRRAIESIDVSAAFGIAIEFEVFAAGHLIMPRLEFCYSDGGCLFWTLETESEWQQGTRPPGHYASIVWIPANFFNHGRINIGIAICSLSPTFETHVNEPNLIGLQITDHTGNSVTRGDFPAYIPGAIRPLLRWTSE